MEQGASEGAGGTSEGAGMHSERVGRVQSAWSV